MPERRPVIGITTYVADARWGPWDQPAALVPRGYVDAVWRAGGRPVLLPPSREAVADTLELVDGLILCGGPDVEPSLYGQRRAAATVHLSPERDLPELDLLQGAVARDRPVLGICRGMQLLNVACGGSLVQHLPDAIGHDRHATRPGRFDLHQVQTVAGSRVAAILGAGALVHSGHHQGLAALGEGLTVGARAADGTIEAIERPASRFVVGVLWHPEQGEDGRLFTALARAAGADRPSNRPRLAAMPPRFIMNSLGRATRRVPGLRRVPVVKLLAAGEVALMARDHLMRLTPAERRRLVSLVRTGRGRRHRLTDAERRELEKLLEKLEARFLVGEAVDRLSPVPLPQRLLYGGRRRN